MQISEVKLYTNFLGEMVAYNTLTLYTIFLIVGLLKYLGLMCQDPHEGDWAGGTFISQIPYYTAINSENILKYSQESSKYYLEQQFYYYSHSN